MKFYDLGGNPESGQDNQVQRTLVTRQLQTWCPLLEYLEFYPVIGNADKPLKSSTATGGGSRALNATYPDNLIDPELGDISLKIFGGKVQVDDAHTRRFAGALAAKALGGLRSREISQFSRRMGQALQYAIVNSTSDGNPLKWDGLLASVPAGRTSSFNDTLATKEKIEKLLEKIVLGITDIPGGATFVLMDNQVLSRLSTLGMGYVGTAKNELGVQIETIMNVPIVIAGYGSVANSRVLPWTSGAAGNATKIIIGRSSEQGDIAFASNVGLVVKDLGLQHPHWTTTVEFDIDMEILNDESIYVIDEIQAS